MKELTKRQKEVLDFIVAFQQRIGRTPTGTEIAEHFKFSDHSSAYQHLKLLAKKGYIELTQLGRRKPMGIRLTEPAQQEYSPSWPLLGAIPAGPLAEALDDTDKRIQGLDDLIGELRQGDYFLRVDGDSMIDAGLHPGQYVIIRPGIRAKQGDICAVWVEGEGGTLKQVYFEKEKVRLCPANPAYDIRIVPVDQIRIQGILVAALAVQGFKR